MKSVRLYGLRDLRYEEDPNPIAANGEKLVHVRAVGICGSDLHWFSEGEIGDAKLESPLILGHEFAGETKDGQSVVVDPAIPCGLCELCQAGHPNLCPDVIFAGHGRQDGALRELIAWDEKYIFPIPDTLTYADGAMLEPLGVALHAMDLAKVRVGMTVGVFGCGPLGLLIIQLAQLMGTSTIISTDILPHRVEAAKSLGANYAILTRGIQGSAEILALTKGRGVDVAFEVAGVQDAVEAAFNAVKPGGKVILVGIPADDKTSFTASIARRKGLTIKLVRRMKHTYPRAIDLVAKGMVDVRSLVTHRFPLEKASEAFHVAEERKGLKVIIEL